jgi:isocitrate dehydrogenase (NAD+)
MSGVMMLRHLHEEAIADKIERAYHAVLSDGKTLTRDLGGSAGTSEFTDAIIAKIAPRG